MIEIEVYNGEMNLNNATTEENKSNGELRGGGGGGV